MIRTRFGSPVTIIEGSRDTGRAIVRRDDGAEFDVSLVELRETVPGEIDVKIEEARRWMLAEGHALRNGLA